MNVLIDAANLHQAGGLRVGTELIKRIIALKANWNYVLILPDIKEYQEVALFSNVKIFFIGMRFKYIKRLYVEYKIAKHFKSVVLNLTSIPIFNKYGSQILLLHNPHYLNPFDKNYSYSSPKDVFISLIYRKVINISAKYISTWVVQTPVVQNVLIQLGINREDTRVLPIGLSRTSIKRNRRSGVNCQRQTRKYSLLCLSYYYAHKNLEVLLGLEQYFKNNEIEIILTISKDQGQGAAKIINTIEKSESNIIKNIGPVEQSDIEQVYNNSDAFILPTRLETLGIIYYEAMNYKKPILTSDLPFAKWICGDGALYFNPNDAMDIADKIKSLMTSREISSSLLDGQNRQLKTHKYCWTQAVKDTISEIEKLFEKSN